MTPSSAAGSGLARTAAPGCSDPQDFGRGAQHRLADRRRRSRRIGQARGVCRRSTAGDIRPRRTLILGQEPPGRRQDDCRPRLETVAGGQAVMQRQPLGREERRGGKDFLQRPRQFLAVARHAKFRQAGRRKARDRVRDHHRARRQRIIAAVAHETRPRHDRHMAVQHHPGAGIDLRQRIVVQPLAPPQPVGHHPPPARPPDLRLEPGLHRFQHDAAVGARRMAADEDQRDVVGLRGTAARVEMASLRCLRQEFRCDAPFGKTPHHQPRAAEHGLVAPEHRHRRQIGRADHPQQVGQSRHRLFQMRAGDMQDDRPSIRSRRRLAPKEQRCLAAGLGADRPGQAFGILGVTPGGLAGPCGVDAQLEEHACAVLHTLLRLRLGHHGADDVPEVVAIVLSGSIARLKQTGHGGCVSGTHKSRRRPEGRLHAFCPKWSGR